MMSKVQHSWTFIHTINREDLGTRLSCFGCEKKNGRTVGGTFHSIHDELLYKNIARRQLEGQHLLFKLTNESPRWTFSERLPKREVKNVDRSRHTSRSGMCTALNLEKFSARLKKSQEKSPKKEKLLDFL